MSVIAGWSIYEGLLTNILPQNTENGEKKEKRNFVQLLRGTPKTLKVLFPALSRSHLKSPFKR